MWTISLIQFAAILILSQICFQPLLITASSRGVYSHNGNFTSRKMIFYTRGENSSTKGGAIHAEISHIYHKNSPLFSENCDENCRADLRLTRLENHVANRKVFNQSVKLERSAKNPINTIWMPGQKLVDFYTAIDITATMNDTPQRVFLAIDTGSFFTWWQCKHCTSCFQQKLPLFDPAPPAHHTFLQLTRADWYCHIVQSDFNVGEGADDNECNYNVRYGDGSYSSGIVGEDFTRWSVIDDTAYIFLQNTGFGCGKKNHLTVQTGVSGILGLANAGNGMSIPEQFHDFVGSSFQYCLPQAGHQNPGFLILGNQALPDPKNNAFHSQPLVHRFAGGLRGLYYLDVVDFHVEGRSVGIPPGTFDFYGPGNSQGGFFADSGTMFTEIIPQAYYHLRDVYRNIMRATLGNSIISGVATLDTCWHIGDRDPFSIQAPKFGPIFRDGTQMTFRYLASFFTYKTHNDRTLWCYPVILTGSTSFATVFGGYSMMQMHIVIDQTYRTFRWRGDDDLCTS